MPARRPFYPAAFDAFLKRTWPGLIQAMGMLWLAARTAHVGEVSIAGAICRTGAMGYRWAAVSQDRQPDHSDWIKRLRETWVPGWGDRRQERVFIGQNLDQEGMRAAFDDCLVGSRDSPAFDPAAFRSPPDPFSTWERAHAA